MTKQELQSALNVEQAIRSANNDRHTEEILAPTQYWGLDWHSAQRIEAIYRVAADRGWTLEVD